MARFNAAVMDGALDKKFQNRYNYLLDLLDTAYIVEKTIDGTPIKLVISPEEGFAFYQGGGASGWTYRGGLELINEDLFLTANAIKGVELSDRYMLWEDDPSTTGDPQLQLYDDDLRVGRLGFTTSGVSLIAYPTASGDYSQLIISADQYTANPEDYVNIRLYGNKQANNYAKINVYSNVLSGGGDYASYIFSPTGIIARLNGSDKTVYHSGNDSALVKKSEVLYSVLSKSSDQTFGTSTSSSVVEFDTETGDCSLDSYGCKVPTGNFIAIVTAWIWWDANSTGLRFVKIRKNSTDISMQNMNATSSGIALIQASASFAVTTGDIIYAYVYQSSGGDLNMDLASRLFVTLIPTD